METTQTFVARPVLKLIHDLGHLTYQGGKLTAYVGSRESGIKIVDTRTKSLECAKNNLAPNQPRGNFLNTFNKPAFCKITRVGTLDSGNCQIVIELSDTNKSILERELRIGMVSQGTQKSESLFKVVGDKWCYFKKVSIAQKIFYAYCAIQ